MLRKSNADKEPNPDRSQVCEQREPDFYLFSHSTQAWRENYRVSLSATFLLPIFQVYIWEIHMKEASFQVSFP